MASWFTRLFGGLGGGSAQLGNAVVGVAEVFTANKTKRDQIEGDAFQSVVSSHKAEFQGSGRTWFDSFINGINRLPRPTMALGTIGLFIYAIVSPDQFAERMIGIAIIPEPLWWLIGVVVAFYFGARESHHLRMGQAIKSVSEAKNNYLVVKEAAKPDMVDKSELTDLDSAAPADTLFQSNPVLDQL